ncbi:MAG: lectin-like protein, partial [Planctomycetota bacterium]
YLARPRRRFAEPSFADFCFAETLEPRRLLSGGGVNDFDQITEATDIGAIVGTRWEDGDLAGATDVDVFRIELAAGQTIDAYLAVEEPTGGAVDALLRLHDASGTLLLTATDADHPPGDSINTDLTFTAPTSGAYYLSVAAAGNTGFDLVTGGGDIAGTTPVGKVDTGLYRVVVFTNANTPATAGNGHYYALSSYGTWAEAQAEAEAAGGHLVTIGSQAEQDFLERTFLDSSPTTGVSTATDYPDVLWIGLSDSANEGTFEWVTGEAVTYTNWQADEPNDLQEVGGEDFGVLNWHWVQWRNSSNYDTSPEPGSWNDIPGTGHDGGTDGAAGVAQNYRGIIEFDTLPTGFGGTLIQWEATAPTPVQLTYVNGGDLFANETPRTGNGTQFGSISIGETGHLRRYVIENTADVPALIRNLALPEGFIPFDNNANAIAGDGLTIPANTALGFTVQMLSDSLGTFGGEIAFEFVAGAGTFDVIGEAMRFDVEASVVPHLTSQLFDNILYIHGSPDGETFHIVADTSSATVDTDRNDDPFSDFDLAEVGRIEVYTYGGADTVARFGAGIPTYIFGGDDDDRLTGGTGNDTLTGGAGKNFLYGGDGDDRLNGSNGRDFLFGQDGNDRLYGRGGDDDLFGGAGVDRLFGDEISGPFGNDQLHGGSSNDKLYGRGGNDSLFGNSQNDLLDAGPGDDLLNGGTDADTLFGGSGNDTGQVDTADIIDGIETVG